MFCIAARIVGYILLTGGANDVAVSRFSSCAL